MAKWIAHSGALLLYKHWGWIPVGAAEHRNRFGIERAALFELDLQAAGAANPASSASAQTGEKRREPA